MPDAHAKTYGASQSARWMACPGSVVLTANAPRTTNAYAQWGTAAHEVAAACLEHDLSPEGFEGEYIRADGAPIEVDAEMVSCVREYVNLVRSLRDSIAGAELLVEQRLSYGDAIDAPFDDGWGTGDAVIITDDELIVVDLKTGRGEDIDPENNSQLQLYALGAYALLTLKRAAEIRRIRCIISQPRAGGTKEWSTTPADLMDFAADARTAVALCEAAKTLAADGIGADDMLHPGEKQCRWCPAAATCPALRDAVMESAGITAATPDEFAEARPDVGVQQARHSDDDEWLSASMKAAPLLEHWLKAVRGEVEKRLLAGVEVPDFKLVRGKQGNRQWSDEDKAAAMMRKTFRLPLEKAYDMKLISPTSAEKLLADESPSRWAKLQPLIQRAEGKLSVAPVSDPRPAVDVTPVADEFADENPPADVSSTFV